MIKPLRIKKIKIVKFKSQEIFLEGFLNLFQNKSNSNKFILLKDVIKS